MPVDKVGEIFVGTQADAKEVLEAASLGIKSVVNLRMPTEEGFENLEDLCKSLHLHYIHAGIDGATCEASHVNTAVDSVKSAEKPTLIYCRTAGRAKMLALLLQKDNLGGKVTDHAAFGPLPDRFKKIIESLTA